MSDYVYEWDEAKNRANRTETVPMVDTMKKEYDFSKSVRNPYLSKAKKQLTIRVDEDTISYFRALAERSGIPLTKHWSVRAELPISEGLEMKSGINCFSTAVADPRAALRRR